MALDTQSRRLQQARDSLGPQPEIRPLTKVRSERLRYTERYIIRQTRTIGESWIVGSSTNGIVGTNTSTQGGSQQVVGSSGKTTTTKEVSNRNDKFIDYFHNGRFEDDSNTTAIGDYSTNYRIDFTDGQVYRSNLIYKGTKNVVSVVVGWSGTGTLSVEVSADNGSNWESVTEDTKMFLTNQGNELIYRVTAMGVATLTEIDISYGR